ncbi:NAD(P)H-binding protein [Streptomyces malaysiensis]|uniref:NAD(P)H-binding protein n=1 Tax=Streptomyces malaysiensis TaxID=92644 RepID=UPI00368CD63F
MILVTGATGAVGGEVVDRLLERGEKVRVLTRNPEGARRWAEAVDVVTGDLADPGSLGAALDGVDRAFLLLVLPGIPQAGPIVAAVRDAGVRHVALLSSIRAGSARDSAIKQVNLAAEAVVQGSGLDWTVLRGGTFMSNTLPWAPSVRAERVVRAFGGDFRSSAVDPRDVGEVAARVLADPAPHRSRVHTLTGGEVITVAEQVALLAELLGEPVAFEELPEAVARGAMVDRLRYPPAVADAMLTMLRNTDESLVRVDGAVAEVLGRPPRSYREWAADHIEAFR